MSTTTSEGAEARAAIAEERAAAEQRLRALEEELRRLRSTCGRGRRYDALTTLELSKW